MISSYAMAADLSIKCLMWQRISTELNDHENTGRLRLAFYIYIQIVLSGWKKATQLFHKVFINSKHLFFFAHFVPVCVVQSVLLLRLISRASMHADVWHALLSLHLPVGTNSTSGTDTNFQHVQKAKGNTNFPHEVLMLLQLLLKSNFLFDMLQQIVIQIESSTMMDTWK